MNNNFDTTVQSLFKGMDNFITTKTVVGDAVTIGDTIILPLVDVSFGVGAGAFAGDKKHKLMGMLSTDNDIPLYTLSAVDGKTSWKDKSANEILDDINGMVGYQAELTQDVERADTLALPPAVFIDISTRQIPGTGFTVKKFLMDNAPYLKEIVSAPELSGGNASTNPYGVNVALMYTNSVEKFSLEIPMAFYQYPLQNRNLEVIVPCEERVAGIIMYYPLSALIAVGV